VGRQHTKVAAPSEAPLERLPWGADSGCTVGLVILLWLSRDRFGWQAFALPTLLYLPLESAHLQSMDLPGRVTGQHGDVFAAGGRSGGQRFAMTALSSVTRSFVLTCIQR
jgi:hypothetical protein